MITFLVTIIPLLTVIGSVLIAYFRWRSTSSKDYKEKAKAYGKQAKKNANAILSTASDAIKQLRDRANRKNTKS